MSVAPPPDGQAGFDAAAFQAQTGATAAQMADLVRYRVLLEEWNGRMNLVGPSAVESFWPRHAFDSAQLLPLAPKALRWADLGAGAGFPGLVLAILLKGLAGAEVHLVESIAKRCRFLEAVTEALDLPARIHNARAENLKLTGIDVVTARACAPLSRLFGYARPVLRGKTVGLFLKGRDVESELAEARKSWRFEVELIPSRSDPSGRIVRVQGLARG